MKNCIPDGYVDNYDLQAFSEDWLRDVNEGLTYKMKIRFYDIEDLNCDRTVDFKDFSVLADNWKRTDCNSTNNWCDYADLDRDGNVDEIDLMVFSEDYLKEE